VPFDVLKFYIEQLKNLSTQATSSSPIAGFTFISTDQIEADATTGNSMIDNNILWTVISNPQNTDINGNVVDSGTVTFNTNTSQIGPTTTFTLNPPAAQSGRYGKLSYIVSATIINNLLLAGVMDQVVMTQDDIDQIRQEYVDMGKLYHPARGEFVNSSTYSDPGGHFPFSEVNWGDYSWAIFTIADKLESMRTAYNNPISLSSGYRNPVHNANIIPTGAPESRHIYGDAADIRTNNDPVMWNSLEKIAQSLNACCEPLSYGIDHLHVDWRSVSPVNQTTCPASWNCTKPAPVP
jgi:hypothetical protein